MFTLTPLARAVRIASTSSPVSGVRVRLLGSADVSMSGSSGSPNELSGATRPLIPRGNQLLDPLSRVPIVVDGVHQKVIVQTNDITGLSSGFRCPSSVTECEGLDVGVQ